MKKNVIFFALTILFVIILLFPFISKKPKAHIMIDAGHGGKDPGTTSLTGIYEKDINLQLANKLRKKLWLQGYKVDMIRTRDEFIELADRTSMANEFGVDIFLSIHCNAIENKPDIEGIQVLYYPEDTGKNEEMANIMMNHMIASTGALDRGCIPRENLLVLRDTRMKSLILETGFLTNEKEASLLEDKDYQDRMLEGILSGLDELVRRDLIANSPDGLYE